MYRKPSLNAFVFLIFFWIPIGSSAQLIGDHGYSVVGMNLGIYPAASADHNSAFLWGRMPGDGIFDLLLIRVDHYAQITQAKAYRTSGMEIPTDAIRINEDH